MSNIWLNKFVSDTVLTTHLIWWALTKYEKNIKKIQTFSPLKERIK